MARLVTFATITLCVASQQVFIVLSVHFITDSVWKLLDTPLCKQQEKSKKLFYNCFSSVTLHCNKS